MMFCFLTRLLLTPIINIAWNINSRISSVPISDLSTKRVMTNLSEIELLVIKSLTNIYAAMDERY